MSGPKKADVVAALNVARNTQRTCAALISRSETATVQRVLDASLHALQAASGEAGTLSGEAAALTADDARVAGAAVQAAREAAARAGALVDEARAAAERARTDLEGARQREEAARALFDQAEAEYRRASAAVEQAGSHYLTREMQWARAAQGLYDRAAAETREAEKARRAAEVSATAALGRANQALAAQQSARGQVRSARAEAETRRRAEVEARRIAEEARRRATLALDGARAALAALDDLPHARFAPGTADELAAALRQGAARLDGSPAEAASAAAAVEARARETAERVAAAAAEHARRRGDAEARTAVLTAAVESADAGLLRDWGPHPDALERARAALEGAGESLRGESFDEAGARADAAAGALADAVRSAAEARSLDERRTRLGEAIMDTLEELGFDVSFAAGSRAEPLRISGQTPEVSGRGDFDLALPLDGEVSFHVEAAEGDISCVAAVEALQERLAQRGFGWTTTDWGHAEGAHPVQRAREQERVRQQERTRA